VCPDPALLVAYLDGTLFHRDKDAVDRHLETCADCTSLLAAMREKREAEQASKTARSRIIVGAAIVLVSILGYGLWALLPRSTGEQAVETTSARTEAPPPAVKETAPAPAPPTTPPAREAAKQPAKPVPIAKARAETPRTRPPDKPPTPRVLWRTRDLVIESSTDGGMTWVTDHTADRPIRASAFVNADVAWIVGDNGLILRRTKNGWFGATPPADGNIIAVKASSPSKATVTLEDGRVFTTANGGVTWSSAP
jgi:hypothetical protein